MQLDLNSSIENQIPFQSTLMAFTSDVKSGKISGTYNVAEHSVQLLKNLIVQEEWKTAKELLRLVKTNGNILIENLPLHLQFSAGNLVRRLLKIIRDEYAAARNQPEEQDSQDALYGVCEDGAGNYDEEIEDLQDSVVDHINEYQTELETSCENIARESTKHIHTNEIILTIGTSTTVETFLKEASTQRKFEVIVCECAPSNMGRDMALKLSKSKIQTTLISDSAMFGMMSRVNKVIIGAHTVLANGGLRADCGTHAIALAAKHFSVPVIVLAGMFKLSPLFLCSVQEKFNQLASPEPVISYSEGVLVSNVHAYNPLFDYVPPELVTLFISNVGGHAPSYVYRLLSEFYHPEDTDL